MKKTRVLAGLVAAAVMAALAAGCTTNEGDTVVQTQGAPSGITVTGTGRVSGTPEIASVFIGVQVESATVEEGREKAAQVQTAVIKSIKDNGVGDRDVQTSNFSIQPRYDFRSGTNQITGYTVTNTLTIKVRKLDQLDKIVDEATRAGGNSIVVQGITFGIDDAEKLRSQAREEALKQAKARAEEIARVAGVTLGKPLSIVEDSYSPVIPRGAEVVLAPRTADTSTPFETGEFDVFVNVQVLYRIE